MVPRPAVRAVARVVNAVALDDRAFEPPGLVAHRAHAGIHVHADLPAFAVRVTVAAPAADVVVLDHHVVRAGEQANRILLRTLQREAADDDVGRRDRDVVLLGVAAIDGRAVTFVEHIAARRAALGDLERASGGGLHRTRDWKALAPGAGADLLPAERDLVRGAGLELDDAAAALAVAGVEPEGQRLAPARVTALAEPQRAAARSGICRWCPVDAERFESGDDVRLGAEHRDRSRQRHVHEKVAHKPPRMRRARRCFHRRACDGRPSTVGRTLTPLSNVDYIVERKAEIKMAKRHPPAYTFPPQGNITDKGRGRCEFS